jgi:hypothetical protein
MTHHLHLIVLAKIALIVGATLAVQAAVDRPGAHILIAKPAPVLAAHPIAIHPR